MPLNGPQEHRFSLKTRQYMIIFWETEDPFIVDNEHIAVLTLMVEAGQLRPENQGRIYECCLCMSRSPS